MKKRLLIVSGVLLSLLAGCGDKAPAHYEKGMEKLEKQQYEAAAENFQEAVKAGEKTVLSWRGVGIARTLQGNYDKAEEAFLTALKLTEKSEKAVRNDLSLYLANARFQQQDYEGCIDICDELLSEEKQKDAYFLRGSSYLHLSQYGEAASDFGKITAHSKDFEDYLDIYKVYSDCDLKADGGEYLEEALHISPKNAEDYYDLGRVYYYLGDYKNAETELKKSMKKNNTEAALFLGKVYISSGKLEDAKKLYQDCLEKEGAKAEAYNGLAYCEMEAGDYESTISYIEKGIKENNAEVRQTLLFNEIVAYEKLSDYDTAKKKMEAYLKEYPSDENAVRENYFLETR